MHKPPQSDLPTQASNETGSADGPQSEVPASAPRTRAGTKAQARVGPKTAPAPRISPPAVATVTDRHLPILLSTFRGSLELEAVRQHDKQVEAIIERSIKQNKPIVYVVDARGVSMPSAMVRRHWADSINESRARMDAMLGTFIILDSAIVRGALTAIVWMTDAAKRLSYVPSFEVALEMANATLVANGHPRVLLNPPSRSMPPAS